MISLRSENHDNNITEEPIEEAVARYLKKLSQIPRGPITKFKHLSNCIGRVGASVCNWPNLNFESLKYEFNATQDQPITAFIDRLGNLTFGHPSRFTKSQESSIIQLILEFALTLDDAISQKALFEKDYVTDFLPTEVRLQSINFQIKHTKRRACDVIRFGEKNEVAIMVTVLGDNHETFSDVVAENVDQLRTYALMHHRTTMYGVCMSSHWYITKYEQNGQQNFWMGFPSYTFFQYDDYHFEIFRPEIKKFLGDFLGIVRSL